MVLVRICSILLSIIIKCSAYQSSWNLGHQRVIPQDVMVDVVNNLGLKLLAIHNENNDNNIAISPYGALSVLIALEEGTRGEAVREIQQATHIPADIALVRIGLRDIHRHLKSYFIPEEGFLAGLTLSHDNVTLRREYEDILKFYGYDINAFNNDLYPDFYATTSENPATTGVIETTDFLSEKENSDVMTTHGVTIAEELPSTTPVETVTSTSTLPQEQNDETNFLSEKENSDAMTTHRVTIREELSSTTPIETVTTMSTLPQRNDELTTQISSTTIKEPPTEIVQSAKEDSIEVTTQISTTIKELTTGVVQGANENSEVTTQIQDTTIKQDLTEIGGTTAEVAGTTSTYTTTEATLTQKTTTESTTTLNDQTTASSGSTKNSNAATTTLVTTTLSTTMNTMETATETTQVAETTDSLVEVFDVLGADTTLTPLQFGARIKKLSSTYSTLLPASTDYTITTTTTTTNNATDYGNDFLSDNELDDSGSTITDITETTTAKPIKNETASRSIRSVVDYIIARYYDDHSITQRPPPYDHQQQLAFLIKGKYRESNINFMTYDTVLPFYFVPHLNALALKFPLDSARYYLLLLLPVSDTGIDKLICDLRLSTNLRYIIRNLRYTHVKAIIPSFMLKGYVILTSTFQKLGVRRVFEPRQADFSPMTDDKNIYITNIEQAITVTIRNYVDPTTTHDYRHLHRHDPVIFKADHPFLYFVLDSEIHVTLMEGKIVNPINSRIR